MGSFPFVFVAMMTFVNNSYRQYKRGKLNGRLSGRNYRGCKIGDLNDGKICYNTTVFNIVRKRRKE